MATINIDFTTTPRNARSDAVNNAGKFGTTATAALTDHESLACRNLVEQAFKAIDVANTGLTATCSLSLTSGSMILFSLTV